MIAASVHDHLGAAPRRAGIPAVYMRDVVPTQESQGRTPSVSCGTSLSVS
jgi:hypothetical protein